MKIDMEHIIVKKYIIPLFFLLFGLTSLYFFVQSIYNLFKGINENIVLVEQGSYSMFGVSIGLLSLSSLLIWDQWFIKPISNFWSNLLQLTILFGFLLLFILPHVINYFASNYLVGNGYSICEAASRSWTFTHTTVYVHPPQECYKTLVYP